MPPDWGNWGSICSNISLVTVLSLSLTSTNVGPHMAAQGSSFMLLTLLIEKIWFCETVCGGCMCWLIVGSTISWWKLWGGGTFLVQYMSWTIHVPRLLLHYNHRTATSSWLPWFAIPACVNSYYIIIIIATKVYKYLLLGDQIFTIFCYHFIMLLHRNIERIVKQYCGWNWKG